MSQAPAAPYEELAGLIERQLELAGRGSFDALAEVATTVDELIGGLPHRPPPAAREALERAMLNHRRLTIEIVRGREALLLELSQLELGRRTANGYAPHRDRRERISARA